MISPVDLNALVKRFEWSCDQTLPEIYSVSTDSRDIEKASLYIALDGQRFDGHDFCEAAINNGAAAVLVSKPVKASVPVIVTTNTWYALGQIAMAQRELFKGLLISLTGSAGKTTTKTILATILSSVSSTYATQANFNNEIGVPKTLLSISADNRFVVVEMGASKVGDIAYLCEFAKPDIALITNAAPAHIEGFGSLDGVAKGKGEIYQSLNNGVAIVNRDSPYFDYWLGLAAGNQVITFGEHDEATVRLADLSTDTNGCQFNLIYQQQLYPCVLPLLGRHNALNAAAAVACAIAAGVSASKATQALALVEAVKSRMQTLAGIKNTTVIDDSYNANPLAFEKAIDVLAETKGRRLLVMGDMGELGTDAEDQHRQIGAYAKSAGLDGLYCVGPLSAAASAMFDGQHFSAKSELIEALSRDMATGDTLLIKGSRSAHMEVVVAALTSENQQRESLC